MSDTKVAAKTEQPTAPPAKRETFASFTMKVLNGISIAVVVALVPQALLGELLKALVPSFPQLQTIQGLIGLSASMLPAVIGVMIAMQFKLTPIQTATVGLAAVLGSGVAKPVAEGGFHLQGTGLVINAGLTAALAVAIALYIGPRLGAYVVLFLPLLVVVVAGGIGSLVTYPAVRALSVWLGEVLIGATSLQPVLMGAVMALMFALLICSPISTVGLATAIFLDGVASGTANLGIVAANFGLCIAGWRANSIPNSLLPLITSPKVQMANMMSRPKSLAPIACVAVILGALGGWLGISGTPISAGFGLSGMVGPITALNAEGWGWTVGNVAIVGGLFIVLPLVLCLIFVRLFERLGTIRPEHYKLNFE